MNDPDQPMFETWIGRERRHVALSRADYQLWLRRISEDVALMRDIEDVRAGRTPMLDLDEGDAGVFPGWVFPHLERVLAKLDHVGDAGAQHVFVGFLLKQVLEDLGPTDPSTQVG